MNMDGRIMGLLNRLGDLFLLNIIYLVSCIPVVTIGAATTALYYTTFKMAENRESYVWRDYRQSFRQNWKQATEIWMILLAMILVLGADLLLIGGMSQALGAVVALVVIVLSIFFDHDGYLCISGAGKIRQHDKKYHEKCADHVDQASAVHSSDRDTSRGAAFAFAVFHGGVCKRGTGGVAFYRIDIGIYSVEAICKNI